jgi:hypothetical protein
VIERVNLFIVVVEAAIHNLVVFIRAYPNVTKNISGVICPSSNYAATSGPSVKPLGISEKERAEISFGKTRQAHLVTALNVEL